MAILLHSLRIPTALVILLSLLDNPWPELPDGRDGHPRKSNDRHGESQFLGKLDGGCREEERMDMIH